MRTLRMMREPRNRFLWCVGWCWNWLPVWQARRSPAITLAEFKAKFGLDDGDQQ